MDINSASYRGQQQTLHRLRGEWGRSKFPPLPLFPSPSPSLSPPLSLSLSPPRCYSSSRFLFISLTIRSEFAMIVRTPSNFWTSLLLLASKTHRPRPCLFVSSSRFFPAQSLPPITIHGHGSGQTPEGSAQHSTCLCTGQMPIIVP